MNVRFTLLQSLIPIQLFTIILVTTLFSATMDDYTGMVFPPNHALNRRIDSLPVHPNSDNFISNIGADTRFHPDFGTSWNDDGTARPMGIPYNVVGADQPMRPITWRLYGDESDPGPWPIPDDPYIETVLDWRETDDGDRHMLIIDSSSNTLYEAWSVFGNDDGTEWNAGNGAVYDLASCDLRPDGWTSADAAGLPVFPLLIRYDEVERALADDSEIPHAIRFTVQQSQRAYIWPARHFASSSTDENRPPMGLRFRLKAEYDISEYSPRMQIILKTMKKYGIIMADNGANWFFQGTHDDRWDDDEIGTLKNLYGRDFEAVDISPWMERPGFDVNSAAVPPATGITARSPMRPALSSLQIQQISYTVGNTELTLFYTLPIESDIAVTISDIAGRSVSSLVHKRQSTGKHTLQLSTGKLQGALYLLRLYANNRLCEVIKIAIVR